ncbi:MAG: IS6 family transposase [Thermoplasmata archaeon]|nr:MAG: IS6 family transposase [Thermoplasmata archaeon]
MVRPMRIGEIEKQNLESLRKVRAFAILAKGDTPKAIGKETFLVPSQSDREKRYTVTHNGEWRCNCPDFQKNHGMLLCKHIQSVQIFLKLREKEDILEIKTELETNEIRCDRCNSINVIKRGKRKTKAGIRQRYECKECGRRFTPEPIKHRKTNSKLIALTMDLYFKGLSTRKIADTIYQFYGIKVDHTTIMRWINTYMAKINGHVNKLEPNVGEIWHNDEQKININGEWFYSWNTLDSDSRFLISNAITKERSDFETKAVLKKAKRMAHGINPRAMITDGMPSYPSAVKDVFGEDIIHVYNVGIRDRINNNVLERYHGTYRERDKVMRALDSVETARQMNENLRTYYNFIRKHSALNGMTPAEMAGINLNLGRNRWMSLITQSL